MSPFDFLIGAKVRDVDGSDVAEVVGVTYMGGKLYLSTDLDFDEEEDPDPGEEEDEEPKLNHLKLVGKQNA